MASLIDLTGQRFGRLTVLEQNVSTKRTSWFCICDCGIKKSVMADALKSGNTSSCGCYQTERVRQTHGSDLTRKVFGRLTAVRLDSYSAKGSRWLCTCSCGGSIVARIDSLTSGNTASCGCIRAEAIAAANRLPIRGMRFGKLVAVDEIGTTKHGSVRWRCVCDCGGEKIATTAKLRYGIVISCGCARRAAGITPLCSPRALAKSIEHAHRRRSRALEAGGSWTTDQIDALFKKQRGRCACCREKLGTSYHRDHIVPLSLGGSNDISNIELLCPQCNIKKGALDPLEWARRNGRLL